MSWLEKSPFTHALRRLAMARFFKVNRPFVLSRRRSFFALDQRAKFAADFEQFLSRRLLACRLGGAFGRHQPGRRLTVARNHDLLSSPDVVEQFGEVGFGFAVADGVAARVRFAWRTAAI
jgi:hypothetical protein